MKTRTAPWDYMKPRILNNQPKVKSWTAVCLEWLDRGLVTRPEFIRLLAQGPLLAK